MFYSAMDLIGNSFTVSHGLKNFSVPRRRNIEHIDLFSVHKYFDGKCTPWVVDLSGQMVNAWKTR